VPPRILLADDHEIFRQGLKSMPHSVTLADLDDDRAPEIVALNGGIGGSITIWKRR